MKKWSIVLLMVGLVGVFTAVNPVSAAEFSPTLDDQLSHADAGGFVGAIVILQSPIDIQALDERLHIRQATKAERNQEVLDALQYNANQTQPAFRAELDEAKARGEVVGYTAYWIENLFVIQATREFIESLRPRGDIKYGTENFRAEMIVPVDTPAKESEPPITTLTVPPGIRAIGAYRVNTELGITGQGVLVANCDTGVDGNHPALAARWRGAGGANPWYHCWRDALGTNTQFPNDGNAHGTHVMGTITGRAIVAQDTQWIGCAPDAQWIATNSINQGGPWPNPNFNNDIIDDYQWFANPDSNNNTADDVPDVIQNSWGVFTGLSYPQCFDYWNTVITNCEAAGPVVTWSAGNEATSGLRSPAIYSLNATQIFSVGAVDASAYPNAPYPLASFSSQGPTPCTPANPDNIKPEIAAPGVNVYSSVPGGGYNGNYSGTSMAGPHVAGCVALMRQACPNCDPTTIKNAIMNTAIDAGYGSPGQDNQFGAGFIDCYNAVLAVSNLGHLVGVVRDAANNPLAGATVRNPNGLQSTQTNASGQYDLPLSDGTYSIQYSKFGYVTQQINGIVIVQDQNTTQDVNLNTAPIGTVSGTVTNCSGGPAVGATVTILNTPIAPATTNGSGFYSIANVPQGTYDMRAQGAGCGIATVTGVVIGANTTQDFLLPSDPRFLCSVPDGGGYVACEDGDTGGPAYSWFEVSPNAGGPGTIVPISGDDSYGLLTIPFTFRLYGTNYTSVYCATNGFLTFDAGNATYSNSCLPYALLSRAIFPFWDDLYVTAPNEDISTYYLAAENAFIIEWHNVHYYSGAGNLTFQVWLYNIATNPTPSGDSQVKFQYQSNTGALTSSTVGIQSGTIANQYTCNGTNDANAQGLVAGNRVICFGGCLPPVTGTLAGHITSCTGGPAAGATVSLPGSFYPNVTANANGDYSVNVVPGTYNVAATSPACCPIQSNGHVVIANQTTTVNLTLVNPPDVAETPPDTVRASAPLGGNTSQNLQICNLGVCALNWAITFNQITPLSTVPADEVRVTYTSPDFGLGIAKNLHEQDNTHGGDQLDAQGGPDAFGYRWIDSDEPGGPTYSWVECVNIGQNTGLTGDDQTVSINLPFTFTYYGNAYTAVNVSSNGNVQFGTTPSTQYTNYPLPSASAPANMIAAFWDDLYLPTGGSVWYYNDVANNRFVVQWDTIPHISGSTNRYTFEAILYSNNRIVMQYQRLDGFVNSCTVGQQNAARNDGLQMVYNAAYLHNNLAISIATTPPWMSFGSPTSGTLTQGQCTNVLLNFTAGTLPQGTYNGTLVTTSNDPDENPYTVQVRFTVGALEAPDSLTAYYTLSNNQLSFRWTPSAGAVNYKLLSATTSDGPFSTVVATTVATQVAIPFPGPSRLFYVVIATDGNGNTSLPSPPGKQTTVRTE